MAHVAEIVDRLAVAVDPDGHRTAVRVFLVQSARHMSEAEAKLAVPVRRLDPYSADDDLLIAQKVSAKRPDVDDYRRWRVTVVYSTKLLPAGGEA